MAPGSKRKLKFTAQSDNDGVSVRANMRRSESEMRSGEKQSDPATVTPSSSTPRTASSHGASTSYASCIDSKRARVQKTAPNKAITPVVSARGRGKRPSRGGELPLPQPSPTIGGYSETTMVSRAKKKL